MRKLSLLLLSAGLLGLGCMATPSDDHMPAPPMGEDDGHARVKNEGGVGDASAEAVFLHFAFDGELVTNSTWNARAEIDKQMLYTIGHLNGERSVGRLDQLEITNVESTTQADGTTRITYHAEMPVGWGSPDAVPDPSYTLRLPHNVSYDSLKEFSTKYGHSCVDWGAHDVDEGIMWYYYRPERSGCAIDDADVVEMEATVTESPIGTTGKFPEYHRIWEDDALKVIAVFGKYEDGATSNSDAGIGAYNEFVRTVMSMFATNDIVTTPVDVPTNPGVDNPDVMIQATLPDGKQIQVVALLIDGVRVAGPEFDARYASLTGDADFIAYNGHSGLGANIRAMARKGHWEQGQYSVVFMNGCDTYTYVDSALWDSRSAVNPDDPTGRKNLDIIMNVMPSPSRQAGAGTLAIFRSLLAFDEPVTYEQMFRGITRSQVVVVSGEEDNEYFPGWPGPTPPPAQWDGMEAEGTLARAEEYHWNGTLPEGKFSFAMTGTGDADLYVRIGAEPTAQLFDCRPYRSNADETCEVELTAAADVFVMVNGYSTTSTYSLVGTQVVE